ncbi:MAG: cupin domain-containing protein [Proteobacteria bacterium]|nr:cupin domain-containing protein [Pseudomonadota bacterium]
MNRKSLALFAAVAAFSFVGAQGAAAHDIKPAVKSLLNTPLAGIAGKEANVVLFAVAPGWKIDNHSHPGHIFVYMLQGSIKIEVEGEPERVLGPGDVLYELPDRNMVANNISSTKGARFLVFQVGDIGKPLTVMVE